MSKNLEQFIQGLAAPATQTKTASYDFASMSLDELTAFVGLADDVVKLAEAAKLPTDEKSVKKDDGNCAHIPGGNPGNHVEAKSKTSGLATAIGEKALGKAVDSGAIGHSVVRKGLDAAQRVGARLGGKSTESAVGRGLAAAGGVGAAVAATGGLAAHKKEKKAANAPSHTPDGYPVTPEYAALPGHEKVRPDIGMGIGTGAGMILGGGGTMAAGHALGVPKMVTIPVAMLAALASGVGGGVAGMAGGRALMSGKGRAAWDKQQDSDFAHEEELSRQGKL